VAGDAVTQKGAAVTPDSEPGGTLESLPSTTGLGLRCALRRLREAGLDPRPMLAEFRIAEAQVADSSTRFSGRAQIRFVAAAAELLGDDLFGFHLARGLEPREMGLLHYVVASAANVEEAIRRLARYNSLVHEGLRLQASFGSELRIVLHYVGLERRSDVHQAEIWITALVDLIRRLTGRREIPRAMRCAHARETVPRELVRHFGVVPEFAAPLDELVFAGEVAARPVVSADPYLSKLLLKYCEEAIRHRPAVPDAFRTAVENAIVPELPHGEVQAERIARRLGMSRRTFARKLAAEGLTFTALLDELRLDLARRYLTDPERPISKIAWLLGYREASAFSRAFRRWTGHSPRAARAAGPPPGAGLPGKGPRRPV
jgi:AraC-like DNA-binding protein